MVIAGLLIDVLFTFWVSREWNNVFIQDLLMPPLIFFAVDESKSI